MTKKIRQLVLFSILLLLIVLWFALTTGEHQEPFNPNLLAAHLTWICPPGWEEKFALFLTGEEVQKVFKQDTQNSLYSEDSRRGRIRYAGVSYHGLFAFEESAIEIKPQSWDRGVNSLELTIYNAPGARLLYRIGVRTRASAEWSRPVQYLYKHTFDREVMEKVSITFPESVDEVTEIVLETRGSGAGAWINPRLVRSAARSRLFVVILLDALRADHLSLYGYQRPTSPFLDALSKEAMVFRNVFSTTSWTLPAVASLFSGKTPDQHLVMTPEDRIPADIPLLAELLQERGFLTAAFTGGGFVDDSYGFARGFNTYSNYPGDVFFWDSAEKVFDSFRQYLHDNSAEDLFVFLHTYQIHAPYKAPPEFLVKINPELNVNMIGIRDFLGDSSQYFSSIPEQDRRNLIDIYDASIMYSDQALVGGVVEYLRENDLFAESMLVVLSDHGQEFYDHSSWEHGHSLYRELVSIPLLIKYPRSRLKGDDHALTSITDVASIILAESGIEYDKKAFPGRGRKGNAAVSALLPVSPIIPQFPGKIALINDRYHLIMNFWDQENSRFFNPPPPFMQEIELYQSRDHRQLTNLADRRGYAVDEFRSRLDGYLQFFRQDRPRMFKIDGELEKRLKSLGYLGGSSSE